ncbi:hypothetical protein [Flavobacterium macacae]|uniref:Uncharacterized protein n=1 Tax=Flavobacterium macacae TaxID=2488993 RepID=A0A3P3W131_9FLAO|nr:hypothetical protein [Flavobacterium macacae]RRJ88494.1 hypothetical protein EG849_14540 [Flavobacterium macacae]
MDENRQNSPLQHWIHELSRSLDYATLKITGFETMIKVAEEDVKIKIVKSLVPIINKLSIRSLRKP